MSCCYQWKEERETVCDSEQSVARRVAEIDRAVVRHFAYVVFCSISWRFSQSDRSTR